MIEFEASINESTEFNMQAVKAIERELSSLEMADID